MKKYFIKYGLGGGFGGANQFALEDHPSEDSAYKSAFEFACEEYEAYDGTSGLRSVLEIMQEDEIEDEEEAEFVWMEERESWLDYYAEEYDPKKHDSIIEGLS